MIEQILSKKKLIPGQPGEAKPEESTSQDPSASLSASSSAPSSTEQPKREGVMSRLGHGFKNFFKSTPGETDELGVQKPGKPSSASTFLDMVLPVMFAQKGGLGTPYGIMAGEAMKRGRESNASEGYEEQRKQAQKVAQDKAELAQRAAHEAAMEKISRSNAAAAWRPGETERMLSEYLKSAGEMETIRGLADKATPKHPLTPEYSKKFDELQRHQDAFSAKLFPSQEQKPSNMNPTEWVMYQDLAQRARSEKPDLSAEEIQQLQVLRNKVRIQ